MMDKKRTADPLPGSAVNEDSRLRRREDASDSIVTADEAERVTLRPGDDPDAVLIAASVTGSGWPVLAIRTGTKQPLHSGSATANHRDRWLTSPAAVVAAYEESADDRDRRTGCQYAVMTGQPSDGLNGLALVAIDVDGAPNALAALLAEAGPEAEQWAADTLRVQRPDAPDRMHLYGTVNATECPPTGDLASGLEWRGPTGYVLLPGALHPDGERYAVTGGRHEFTAGHQPEGALYVGLTEPDDDDPTGLAVWAHPLPVPGALLDVVRSRTSSITPPQAPSAGGRTTEEVRALLASRTPTTTDQSAADVPELVKPALDTFPSSGRAAGRWENYTRAAVERIGADLRAAHDWPVGHRPAGPNGTPRGWDRLTADAAYRLAGLVKADWCPLTADDALDVLLSSAPTDSEFTERDVRAKWEHKMRTAPAAAQPTSDEPCHHDEEDGGAPVTLRDVRGEDRQPADSSDSAYRDFWTARPILDDLRRFAHARRVGSWSMLGAVLAHAVASVSPSIVLPPTRGTVASLNLFIALCAESGGGKSATMDAAREFLDPVGGEDYLTTSPGSGEGLLAAYVYVRQERGKAPEIVHSRRSVLLDVDEVGGLGALTARTNSTLLPFLKSAWSGRLLATQNAEASRQRRVEAHTYRLALVAGVQPQHAGVILDDEAGGFPQRWLWLPTYDPDMPAADTEVPEPDPFRWRVPVEPWGVDTEVDHDAGTVSVIERSPRPMVLPDIAVTAILAAAEATNRPIGAPAPSGATGLDGHALLTRAKVAAVLALLDGRSVEISEEDWHLAGVVMSKSDQTRALVLAARGDAAREEGDRKARSRGRAEVIAAESATEERVLRCVAVLRTALAKPDNRDREHTRTALGRFAGSRYDAAVVTEALERLTGGTGELVVEVREARNGKRTAYYRLAVRA